MKKIGTVAREQALKLLTGPIAAEEKVCISGRAKISIGQPQHIGPAIAHQRGAVLADCHHPEITHAIS